MIGVLLVILTIAFFCAWNMNYKHKRFCACLATFLLFINIGQIISNFHNHTGMHISTKVTCHKIVPNQANLLLYSKLGSQKKHNVVLYQTTKLGKMLHTPISLHNHNQIRRTNSTHAYIIAHHYDWKYNNKYTRLYYGLMQPRLYKSSTKVFYIPKSWHVLSLQQAKVMKTDAKMQAKLDKKQLQSPQAQTMLKQKMQAITQQRLQAKIMKNPQLVQSPTAKTKLVKQITKQVKKQYMSKAKQQIMTQALQTAEQSPVGYKE